MEKRIVEKIAPCECRHIAIICSQKWEIHFYGFQMTYNLLTCEVIYKTTFEK